MRVDRGVRRWAVVLSALLAAAAPAAAVVASPPSGIEPGGASTAAADEATGPQPEPVTEAARAMALAEPAIVLIEVQWHGQVHDRITGELLDPEPVSASTRCTGADVGQEGYLLTTGSCLDQASVAIEAFQQIVDRRIAEGSVAPTDAEVLLGELLVSATIGRHPPSDDPAGNEPAERSVFVRRVVTDDPPMPATVVSIADPADGDAAIIKINRTNQPILPLAGDDELALGTELVAVDCVPAPEGGAKAPATTDPLDGDDGGAEEPLRPTYRTAAVSETEPRVLVDLGEPEQQPSSGSIVLTHDAALVGLVDASLATGDALVDLSVIRSLLAEAEVDTELGQVDRDYRAGLDAYYQGRYSEAIGRFDSVLAIIPSHLQAHEYRDAAQSLRDEENETPPPADEVVDQVSTWLDEVEALLGSRSWLVALVVLVAIVAFLVRRRRDDGNPAPETSAEAAATGTPSEDAPAEGSPTEGSPTEGSPTEGSPTEGSPTEGSPTEGAPAGNAPVEDAGRR